MYLKQSCLSDAPIGVFDSGVGGLSVAQEILKHLPQEKIMYLADTAHVPYGARENHDILQLTANAVDWLYQKGCKLVVVACNTASAFSLDHLREHYGNGFPIIGLVPALKPAVLNSKNKMVAVLATPATFRGQLIKDVIQNFALPAGVQVMPVTCLELVPLVEAGLQDSEYTQNVLREILQPMVHLGVDQLVLGCTHYPFLKKSLHHLFKDQLTLVDSGGAVARHTSQMLIKNNLQNTSQSMQQLECYFTGGDLGELTKILQQLISYPIDWTAQYTDIVNHDDVK